MKFSILISGIPREHLNAGSARTPAGCDPLPGHDPEITSLHTRAQSVAPGGLFIAIQGFTADGHDYLDEALSNGAAAVISQKPVTVPPGVPLIRVENTRAALASIAARFYDFPSEKLVVVGITGTNGKTTTSYLIESILRQAGHSAGVVGTVNYRYSGKEYNNPVTTPESLDLQRILHQMHGAGVTHVVMEISSHALDLHRVDGCWLDVAVFTNLSRDHLDYHKDMAGYWACKKKLFTEVLRSGPKKDRAVAVINVNDAKGRELEEIGDLRRISVGGSQNSGIWCEKVEQSPYGISGRIGSRTGAFEFRSSLVGAHNLENILCAAGVGMALDVPLSVVKAGIEKLEKIPGRLEPVANDRMRFVFVDYAHTPDALQNVLSSLTAVARKKTICVFGCGGDRDKGKRAQMGSIAARMSDLTVVTSDNPRSEPPHQIIEQILVGIRRESGREYQPTELGHGCAEKGYAVEPDRRKAIQLAIGASRPGDTVLIAGKGHENYQIIGDTTIAFDDRLEAARAIEALGRDRETGRPS